MFLYTKFTYSIIQLKSWNCMGLHRAFAPRPEVVFLVFVLVSVCVCGGHVRAGVIFSDAGCKIFDFVCPLAGPCQLPDFL